MVMFSNPVDFPAVYEPDAENEFTEHTLFGSTFANGVMKPNPYATMVHGYEDRNESKIAAQATLQQDMELITKGRRGQGKAFVNTRGENTSRRRYQPRSEEHTSEL